MLRPRLLAAALVLAAICPASPAELVRSYSHYTVDGDTPAELEMSLRTRGPAVVNTGQRHPGATKVTFETEIRYEPHGARCRIADARVRVTAHITLPQWRRRASALPETRLLWDTLSSDIRRHEEHHADIARHHAAELERELKAIGTARDCTRLADAVERAKQRMYRQHDEAQTRFDRIEGRNFTARMDRLLQYRMERMERGRGR